MPLLPDWQVFEMCFTEVTCSDCCEALDEVPAPAVLLVADDEEELGVPVIFTSCPTCSLSFAVSPVN